MHPTDIAERIKNDIDAYCERIYNEPEPRWHLGASIIGHECSRYLWYTFRWFRHEIKGARNGRLLNRGHREEARMQEFLREVGFKLRSDECFIPGELGMADRPIQERIEDHDGHFGGSLDDMWEHPDYGTGLAEYKTSGTGARKFGDLLERGVRLAKPVHWAQMCVYGFKRGLRYAVYLCANKNDDDLHVEFAELDHALGDLMIKRAGDIIWSQTPPERCSSTPAYWQCKFCIMRGPCWQQELPMRNCRSCVNAKPGMHGEWHCGLYNQLIPRDFVSKGCDSWTPLA